MKFFIEVSIADQRLRLYQDGNIIMDVMISTASKGAGEIRGSEQTPRGWHKIRAKIGAGAPLNSVFRGRRPTGEIYASELRAANPGRDSGHTYVRAPGQRFSNLLGYNMYLNFSDKDSFAGFRLRKGQSMEQLMKFI